MKIFNQLSPDDWENFAYYYLESKGYLIIDEPSVGPDGGIDLKVEIGGVYCLVSCKNYVHSDKSVVANNERSVRDRLRQHGTNKFIGFYSTRADKSLISYLDEKHVDYTIVDGDEIARELPNLPFSVIQALMNAGRVLQSKTFGEEHRGLLCKCGCGLDLLIGGNAASAAIYLIFEEGEYSMEWRLLDHMLGGEEKQSRIFLLESLFDLRGVNRFIDVMDEECRKSSFQASKDFDKCYSELLELSHQMIYTSDLTEHEQFN